ncbi:hypothetical protein Pmar_PMAR015593 [Perkinsus marinus ATCC 50983]|uniref:Uncharacterized protein n=1 Tax=Perkinsus marinus (strain ATCC 50983 / TXsc) TaxID=423536 RepID=C5KUJ8_PERM5|nr:hypothetical protein Pmar_PMAR015593 [Perkinsus marinus ATCC 50983]EER11885.1 hypothetical protein Pmar_PMAR015593 [Perkinsus marinus ATCC 50983]|eukprot:XP_002780090.1 hypothetical protein Pmar_PMAR015593 [Perkinsus marinus ATCC 50983]
MAEIRVDACGPDVIMQCVAEQLDVASGSVSGEGGIEKLTMEMALSDGCDTSTVVTEQPSGVIKHVQFEMGGYLDQAAVKEALALGLGPSVWMRAVAVEGAAVQAAFEEPFLVEEGSSPDGTSSSPCSTDSLSRAMKEISIGSESEFKSKNSWIVVRVYACTAMEEVECLMNRVRQARDLVTASGSNLYGGVATMTLSDGVNDGCPSDLPEVTHAPVIDVSTEAPQTVDSISSVTMAIGGVWEEQTVRNLLQKAFGEDVVLGDISAISDSGSTYSATEITLSDDASCDRTVLVELLQQLPKVNVDSAKSRRAEVTVCGETKNIKCIRQMLVQARQFTKSLSGTYYGGLTSIEPWSSVTDGCPMLDGNLTAQPEESDEGSGDTTSVVPQQDGGRVVLIKGYYLDDEMTAVFKTALSNVRMGVEMNSSTITAERSSFPTENDSDGELPRRVAEVDCDVTALAVALKSLTLVSEGTISTQRPYKDTRIIICGSAAQLECAANKVGQAQALMRDQGTQLYGGLTELGFDGDSLPVCPLDEVIDYQPSATLTSRSVEFVIEGYFQVQGIAKNLRDAMGESVQDVFLVEIQRSESPTTEPGEMVTTGTPPMVTTQAVPLEETSVTTPPPNRRSLQDTSSKFVCGTNNLADAIRGLARQNETTITQAKVKLTLRACARPARIDCIVDQIGTASAVVDSAGEQLYGGIQSIQTDGVIAKRCDTTDRIDTTGATTVSISATNCLATQTACESDPDRRCYDSSQRCDRQWLCPNGDDEMGCSYQCLNNEVRCPATGLCIPKDLRKGGCQECADEAYVNDDTCVFLKEAKDALLNLPVCEINVVENIFFERGCRMLKRAQSTKWRFYGIRLCGVRRSS